jgi:hypothetical protein
MKTDIEYAALAMGFKHWTYLSGDDTTQGIYILGGEDEWFCPLQDDGDSRRLEIACLNWLARAVPWPKVVTLAYAEYSGFVCGSIGINPDNYRAAVLALAVAIGKTMEGNDNAG